jgi:peptidoglycan/LPS O-acetylase OafA/YrhL
MVLITTGLWFFSSSASVKLIDLLPFGIIILVVVFAVFIGFKRLSSVRRKEPIEDELSKKVLRKTAAMSYYISLYLWLFIMYIQDKVNLETHSILAMGMLGMAVCFAVCWLVFNFIGIKNE